MPSCFAPGCFHGSKTDTCSHFSFPTQKLQRRKWISMCRRGDRDPNANDRLCSCHFVDGKKENGPSVFLHNAKKRFRFPEPEIKKRAGRKILIQSDVGETSVDSPTLQQETANTPLPDKSKSKVVRFSLTSPERNKRQKILEHHAEGGTSLGRPTDQEASNTPIPGKNKVVRLIFITPEESKRLEMLKQPAAGSDSELAVGKPTVPTSDQEARNTFLPAHSKSKVLQLMLVSPKNKKSPEILEQPAEGGKSDPELAVDRPTSDQETRNTSLPSKNKVVRLMFVSPEKNEGLEILKQTGGAPDPDRPTTDQEAKNIPLSASSMSEVLELRSTSSKKKCFKILLRPAATGTSGPELAVDMSDQEVRSTLVPVPSGSEISRMRLSSPQKIKRQKILEQPESSEPKLDRSISDQEVKTPLPAPSKSEVVRVRLASLEQNKRQKILEEQAAAKISDLVVDISTSDQEIGSTPVQAPSRSKVLRVRITALEKNKRQILEQPAATNPNSGMNRSSSDQEGRNIHLPVSKRSETIPQKYKRLMNKMQPGGGSTSNPELAANRSISGQEPRKPALPTPSRGEIILQAENYFLEQDNKKLKDLVTKGESRMSFSSIQNSDLLISQYTGLPTSNHFINLSKTLARSKFSYHLGWKVDAIPFEDQLLLTLMKLRLNLQFFDLSFRFKVSTTTVQNIFITFLMLIHEVLFQGQLDKAPSRVQNKFFTLSNSAETSNTIMEIDCTEMDISIASSAKDLSGVFSNVKQGDTFKVLLAVTPTSNITFVSDVFSGSYYDKSSAERGRSSHHELIATKQMAKGKLHVVRATNRLKCFRILDFISPNLREHASKIVQTCAVIVNLKHSPLQDVEESIVEG